MMTNTLLTAIAAQVLTFSADRVAVDPVTKAAVATGNVVAVRAPYTLRSQYLSKTADGKYDYVRFESGHYYAIAGSFPGEADVERHIRLKNLDQYSPVIVKQDGVKNLRVCIGIFDTEEEAEQFAKGVSSQYWVLK